MAKHSSCRNAKGQLKKGCHITASGRTVRVHRSR